MMGLLQQEDIAHQFVLPDIYICIDRSVTMVTAGGYSTPVCSA